MIRIPLTSNSDYLCHPLPRGHNHIFERLNKLNEFEVHILRLGVFDKPKLTTQLTLRWVRSTAERNEAEEAIRLATKRVERGSENLHYKCALATLHALLHTVLSHPKKLGGSRFKASTRFW